MSFDPLAWISSELQQLRQQHLERTPMIRGSSQGARIVLDGHEYINFGSNDYLGLADDRRLTEAVAGVLRSTGWGSGASPLITGRSASQAELERHLAAFEETEAAIVFPSGFAANAGTLACLAGPGDVILSDAKNHASLIDGCRLSRADVRVYAHGDVDDAQAILANSDGYRRRLIVTDSLFSMDGDFAPLAELVELAERYEAMLVVDEAHATGVIGVQGRGVCELLGVEAAVPVRIGTLSKAVGSIGGFVVGSQPLIDWLFNRARSFVFSTALPPACHVASLTGLKIIRDEPQRRNAVLKSASWLRDELRRQGWQVGNAMSQIVSVYLGPPEAAVEKAAALRQRGLMVPGIRPPTVPVGESLLRISISCDHTQRHLDRLVAALDELRGQGNSPVEA